MECNFFSFFLSRSSKMIYFKSIEFNLTNKFFSFEHLTCPKRYLIRSNCVYLIVESQSLSELCECVCLLVIWCFDIRISILFEISVFSFNSISDWNILLSTFFWSVEFTNGWDDFKLKFKVGKKSADLWLNIVSISAFCQVKYLLQNPTKDKFSRDFGT